jgi:hypothetical protein
MATDAEVGRFARLFKGNTRSYGLWHSKSGRLETVHARITEREFAAHLNGGPDGVGVVPVTDSATVYFAAIDIDTEEGEEKPDIVAIGAKITELGLPLIPCYSKSGDVHCYFFSSEPAPAAVVRGKLAAWAATLGYPGVEVFPKQSVLRMDDGGNMQMGNWINLCYYKAEGSVRCAVVNGQKLTLPQFLDAAERVAADSMRFLVDDNAQFIEAPPCLVRLRDEGVPDGMRNQALYNFAVFFKKYDPKTYREMTAAVNSKFDTPLPEAEAKKTIASAGRRAYVYKCNEEPCASRCQRDVCLTRKFGIGSFIHAPGADSDDLPKFTKLQKIDTDPPRWILTVNGKNVELATQQLMHAQYLQYALAEALLMVIIIPERAWHAILGDLMKTATVVETPDEASTGGLVRAKLLEFTARARAEEDKKVLLRGVPIITEVDDQKYVVFRGTDFVTYLKRNKSEELRGANLWMALRKSGVEHKRFRIDKDTVLSTWRVAVNDDNQLDIPGPNVESEL